MVLLQKEKIREVIVAHISCCNRFSEACQKWKLNRVIGRDIVLSR